MDKSKISQILGQQKHRVLISVFALFLVSMVMAVIYSHLKKQEKLLIHHIGKHLAAELTVSEISIPTTEAQNAQIHNILSNEGLKNLKSVLIKSANKSTEDQVIVAPLSPYPTQAWLEPIEVTVPVVINGELQGQFVLNFYLSPLQVIQKNQLIFIVLSVLIILIISIVYWQVKSKKNLIVKLEEEMKAYLAELNAGQIARRKNVLSENIAKLLEKEFQSMNHLKSQNLDIETSKKIIDFKRYIIEMTMHCFPYGVIILNETGKITFINKYIADLLSYEISHCINKDFSEICSYKDVNEMVYQHIYHNKSIEQVTFNPAESQEKHISAKVIELNKQGDAVRKHHIGYVVIFKDTTAEKLSEENRTDFIANISHELKTPLNTIKIYVDELSNGEEKDKDFEVEAYNVIGDEVERMISLIENLLNITKIEIGNMVLSKKMVNLKDLLNDIHQNLGHFASEKVVNFSVNIPNSLSPVFMDKSMMSVALKNLVTNAIKYNKEGGTVELVVESEADDIRIIVRDTGLGISEQDQKKIFGKFYRSEESEAYQRGGHGLGLALAKQIVELHNGKLTCVSTLGEGTEFIIEMVGESNLLRSVV